MRVPHFTLIGLNLFLTRENVAAPRIYSYSSNSIYKKSKTNQQNIVNLSTNTTIAYSSLRTAKHNTNTQNCKHTRLHKSKNYCINYHSSITRFSQSRYRNTIKTPLPVLSYQHLQKPSNIYMNTPKFTYHKP